MNVYQKLQAARVELQNKDLKKSGNNKFAGYSYFELGDFLPTINKIFNDLKLCSIVSFNDDLAMLQIYDCEKDEQTPITFTSPMRSAALKGCHEIQNLGAIETYQRRYLYMMALEIVEHDALDATTGNNSKEEVAATTTRTLTDAQIKRLYAIAGKKGYKAEDVKKCVMKKKGCELAQMSKVDYDDIVAGYESLPDVDMK